MNTNIFGKALHPLNFRKIAKPLVICISALFILSMLSVLSPNAVQAATAPSALHTSGHRILDANNNDVYLRGIGRAGDLASLTGLWGGKVTQFLTTDKNGKPTPQP
jgi:hypothetical protein